MVFHPSRPQIAARFAAQITLEPQEKIQAAISDRRIIDFRGLRLSKIKVRQSETAATDMRGLNQQFAE
jgi:hypothetical protein